MPILTASTGAAGMASALATGLTADVFWSQLLPFAEVIVTIVVFAFGYRVVKKLIQGSSKAKARV